MPKYTVEWWSTGRGTVTVEADSEDEARDVFWEDYLNGPGEMPSDRQDYDCEVYRI